MTARHRHQETRRYIEAPNDVDETRAARREEPTWELPEPGETIGRYELESVLGSGGMGVVYQAFDPELKRRIALKLLRPELATTSVDRFLEEAQVAAQLQHPVILPVYDVERTEEGGIYYTMQLVEGRTLEQLIGGPASLAEEQGAPETWTRFKLLQAFVTVCRAVSYAHGRGVIHRDLKPSNVMIGPFAEVYLMDWGVAKILGSRARRPTVPFDSPIEVAKGRTDTHLGTIVGTPAYMAPEQARSEEVGRPADIYCLGGVLYQILTGEAPRTGTGEDVVHEMTLREPPPPRSPRALQPDVPAELDELCMKALAHDPADRPPSAGALADTVQAYLEGRSLQAADPEDAKFLKSYSALKYRRPSIAVDVVLLDRRPGHPPRVCLIRRDAPPYGGAWACPGSFVRLEEALEETARRVLREKLNHEAGTRLVQLRAYGDLRRDPRTRVVSIGYLALLGRADDVAPPAEGKRAWFEAAVVDDELILTPPAELAFDHARIVADALKAAGKSRRG